MQSQVEQFPPAAVSLQTSACFQELFALTNNLHSKRRVKGRTSGEGNCLLSKICALKWLMRTLSQPAATSSSIEMCRRFGLQWIQGSWSVSFVQRLENHDLCVISEKSVSHDCLSLGGPIWYLMVDHRPKANTSCFVPLRCKMETYGSPERQAKKRDLVKNRLGQNQKEM